MAEQEHKERMLLGRSPHFFLSREVGGWCSLWLASQGKLNAQKVPRLPWVVFLTKKEPGFCGGQGADRIPPAPEEALGLMRAPAAVLPKRWTRPRRVHAKPAKAEKLKALGCPQGPHVPCGCGAAQVTPSSFPVRLHQ